MTECDGGDGVVKLSIGITTPIKNVLFTPPLKTEKQEILVKLGKQEKQAKLSIHAGFRIVWVEVFHVKLLNITSAHKKRPDPKKEPF